MGQRGPRRRSTVQHGYLMNKLKNATRARPGRELEVQRRSHRDRLFRAACVLCRSRQDAEDLVEETYASVLRRPGYIHGGENLAYALRMLCDNGISKYRNSSRQPESGALDESIELAMHSGGDPRMRAIETRAIYEAVSQLSEPLRDALVAVDIIGLSAKDAAKALGIRRSTVTSRLYRARDQVATTLGGATE